YPCCRRHLLDGDVGADALPGDDEHEAVTGDAEVRTGRDVDADGRAADNDLFRDRGGGGVDLELERTSQREGATDRQNDVTGERTGDARGGDHEQARGVGDAGDRGGVRAE